MVSTVFIYDRVMNLNVKLMKAVADDTERLLEIQKICFTPHLERYQDYETSPAAASFDHVKWQIENDNFYKIIYNDLWVGSINIRKLDDLGNYKLHIINVLPQYQGKRIGQAAIELAEAMFCDAKTWSLETLEDMPSNRHVYEKMGYKFTGKTENINDKLTLVFYKKSC